MSGRDLTWSIAVLEDKIRLIRGQSTENSSIHAEIKKADELQARLKQLKEDLRMVDEGKKGKIDKAIIINLWAHYGHSRQIND